MTKEELTKVVNKQTEELIELRKTVESQKYLDEGIKAKDREINKLKEELIELKKVVESQKHLDDGIKAKDREINKLKEELIELKKVVESKEGEKATLVNTNKQNLEQQIEARCQVLREQFNTEKKTLTANMQALEKHVSLRESQLNELLAIHGDLLKTLEATTNSHLMLNSYYVNKLKN